MSRDVLLRLDALSFGHGAKPLFAKLNLSVAAAECHCLLGATGSGKSSLLKLMAGLSDRPWDGGIHIRPQVQVALVMQDTELQLLRRSIGAEVAFGLENIGVEPARMPALVRAALVRVGLDLAFETRVDGLSLGQKYRLMLASQLVLEPDVLLLDEPWAQLDDAGVSAVNEVLIQLKASGMAIVIAEHHPSAFAGLIDKYWVLHEGQLQPSTAMAFNSAEASAEASALVSPVAPALASTAVLKAVPPVSPTVASTVASITQAPPCSLPLPSFGEPRLILGAFELILAQGCEPLVTLPSPLQLHRGELRPLVADNGAGKSSLLKAMAGLLQGVSLPLSLDGDQPKLGRGGLALMLQRPSRQLFELSVRAELAFGVRDYPELMSKVEWMLAFLGIGELADSSPHTLSWGQQHVVLLASLILTEPAALLLDDPFAGLDATSLAACLRLLDWYLASGGCCLLACHRMPEALLSKPHWRIEAGLLLQKAGTEPGVMA